MDKSWVFQSRSSLPYRNGVKEFIKFGLEKEPNNNKLYCPCKNCCNRFLIDSVVVEEHLVCDGFMPGYAQQVWFCHGERLESESYNLVLDAACQGTSSSGIIGQSDTTEANISAVELNNTSHEEFMFGMGSEETPHENDGSFINEHVDVFAEMLGDSDDPLFPGCKNFSTMSFLLRIYHIKALASGSSSKLLSLMLELLKEAFPQCTSLPSSYYEAKKSIKKLDLGYEKIHACPNDCLLYTGEYSQCDTCETCGASRWTLSEEVNCDDPFQDEACTQRRKKPAKVLRYFPLIPRLKRMFQSSKIASSMRWHDVGRTKDGKLRHPADAEAWKAFDVRYPDFAADPRNLRLGLASDGFNPFRNMSTSHSTWPVVLVPYNMEPWTCMKRSSLILSMIIPGEKGPGNDIDVYLKPLITELQQLWDGVQAFDAYTGENFTLRACLMWTINDFPAYGNLSGWSTSGYTACPICAIFTNSRWLVHGRKLCYLGHRKWLDPDHLFRTQKEEFDNTIELGLPPIPPSGIDVLNQVEGTRFTYGKKPKSNKKRDRSGASTSMTDQTVEEDLNGLGDNEEYDTGVFDISQPQLWKKRSIFFDLPYWKYNLLRHNLDVMHIEKNVFDNVIGTLLNLDKKSKDNLQARWDLKDMGIRHELHPYEYDPNDYPLACYNLTSEEKDMFLSVLKGLKVPDGYASNISRCVNLKERKLSNLKSHDCHVLMQDILPIALRGVATKTVLVLISELSTFFKKLCAKVLDPLELDQLQADIALTLCKMEKVFPPGFFTIMVHLLIHLPQEAKLGGPVQYRWMYFMERFLMQLKELVHNRAHPEGSIAEGYVAVENITFCSKYIPNMEMGTDRVSRNYEQDLDGNYLFSSGGRVLGKLKTENLDRMSLDQAHRYVLVHSDVLNGYRREFLDSMRHTFRGRFTQALENKWLIEKFPIWLMKKVQNMSSEHASTDIIALARGPNNIVKTFDGFVINGFRFHTKRREALRRTQNSGVMVEAHGKIYYGVIKNMLELDYFGSFKVVLFRCDWVDVNSPRGLKVDQNGFTLVNFSKLMHTGVLLKDDPFIFSSQAKQVFYVDDPKTKGWQHVVMTKPRDIYDMGGRSEHRSDEDTYTECLPTNVELNVDLSVCHSLLRVQSETSDCG